MSDEPDFLKNSDNYLTVVFSAVIAEKSVEICRILFISDKMLAIILSIPAICRLRLLIWKMKSKCLSWRVVPEFDCFGKAKVSVLWSVYMAKCLFTNYA